LSEAGEDVEVVVINAWGDGDQGLVVNDAVRELASNDVGVSGELFKGRRCNVEVVRYARVMVAVG
jgi:hypothetical protein